MWGTKTKNPLGGLMDAQSYFISIATPLCIVSGIVGFSGVITGVALSVYARYMKNEGAEETAEVVWPYGKWVTIASVIALVIWLLTFPLSDVGGCTGSCRDEVDQVSTERDIAIRKLKKLQDACGESIQQ
jgi:hypothetical protein